MPLRRRLEAVDETVQEMELAADAKYDEGEELLRLGRGGAGIYLLGYAAEMLLKSAYFRYGGASSTDRVAPLLAPAARTARQLIPAVNPEAFHSLRFWGLLLREKRRQQNRPLPPDIDAAFVSRTRRLYQNWWVSMRYRGDRSLPLEATSVLDDVTWLRANHQDLWR